MAELPDGGRYRVARAVTRQRLAATGAAAVLAVTGGIALARLGDDSPSGPTALVTDPRTPLEAALLGNAFTQCNGGCAGYEATAVACDPASAMIDGRRWHRCRIRYAADPPAEHPREPTHAVCATSEGSASYRTRPLPNCRPS